MARRENDKRIQSIGLLFKELKDDLNEGQGEVIFKYPQKILKPIILLNEEVIVQPCNKEVHEFRPGEIVLALLKRKRPDGRITSGSYGLFLVHSIGQREVDSKLKDIKSTRYLILGRSKKIIGYTQNPRGIVTHVISKDGVKETIKNRIETERWHPDVKPLTIK
jgi:hypothetical protein